MPDRQQRGQQQRDRTTTSQNGSGAVKIAPRPAVLVGVRIPSRNESVRQLVWRVYEDNPHLQRSDLWGVTRYSVLSWKFRRLAELLGRLPDGGGGEADLETREAPGGPRS